MYLYEAIERLTDEIHAVVTDDPSYCLPTFHDLIAAAPEDVKLWVTDGAATRECIWFGAGELSLPTGRFDLAFTPQLNYYNGSTQVQLKVLDWRPAE